MQIRNWTDYHSTADAVRRIKERVAREGRALTDDEANRLARYEPALFAWEQAHPQQVSGFAPLARPENGRQPEPGEVADVYPVPESQLGLWGEEDQ